MAVAIARVKKGDPLAFPASAYNAFAETAEKFLANEARFQAGAIGLGVVDGSVIRVRNATGADRNYFDVVNLAAPVFSPSLSVNAFAREVAMTGNAAGTSGMKTVAVLLEPVQAGGVGRARVAGVMPVRVRVRQRWHRYARIIYGHDCFDSDGAGPVKLLWVAPEPIAAYGAIGDDVRPAYAMINVETQVSLRGTYNPASVDPSEWDGNVLISDTLDWIGDWDVSDLSGAVESSGLPTTEETHGMLTATAPFGVEFCDDTLVEVTWQPYYQAWVITGATCPPEGGCDDSGSSGSSGVA